MDDELKRVLGPGDSTQFQLAQQVKMTDWENEPSLQQLKADLEAAKPSHDALVSSIRRWNNLLRATGEARPPKVKGRSSVQPKLIRRQAEWRYSALSEPFLSSDKLFKVSPATFEDESAARQNELVLNYQFRTKLNRVQLVDNLVRSLVDEGTCIVRLGWARQVKVVREVVPVFSHYPLQSGDQAQLLQQAVAMRGDDPRGYSDLPAEVRAAAEYLEESGVPTVAVQTGTEVQEHEIVRENRPTVDVLNPANVYIDPSCEGDLDKALFAVVSFETNRAELLKEPDRYKNLDQVNWEGNSTVSSPDHESSTPDSFQLSDSARKKVVANEYWGSYDVEGTGQLVPFVATWIGDTFIRMELNPFPDEKLPLVVIPYSPLKRELYGEPDAEVLEDNQRIHGALTRGLIDLMARSANSQKGFAKSLLDPVNRRKYENGEDYEFNPTMPTSQGIIEHVYPALPQSALQMMELQNQDAESLTGVKAFSGGLSGNAYGNVATGIKGMLDASAKREMAILRRLARGVSEIGRKILLMNSVFLSDEEVVRVTNEQLVTVRREDLRGEFDCVVDISTYEVDNTKSQDLGFMLQTLGPNMDPSISMMILSEIAELKRMPGLAHKLKTWRPQPDPAQQQLQALELQKKQAELAEIQSRVKLNEAQAQAAMAAAGQRNLDRVEQETGTKHARELDKQQAQSRGNQNLAVTHSLLKPRREGESAPDVNAAIGFNAVSEAMEKDNHLSRPGGA